MADKHPAYDAEPVYKGEVYANNYDIPEHDQAAADVAAVAGKDASDCDDDKDEAAAFTFAAAEYDDYRGYRPEHEPANTYIATVDSQEGYGHYDAVVDEVDTVHVTYQETVDCVCIPYHVSTSI